MKIDVVSENSDIGLNLQNSNHPSSTHSKYFKKVIFENWSQYLVLIIYGNSEKPNFNFEYLYNGCSKSIYSQTTIQATILVRRMLVPKSSSRKDACLWYLVSKGDFPIGSKHLLDDQDIEAAINGGVSKLCWTDFIGSGIEGLSIDLNDLKKNKREKTKLIIKKTKLGRGVLLKKFPRFNQPELAYRSRS